MQAEILVEKGKIARLMIELEEVKENSARLHTESLSKQAKIDQLEVRRSLHRRAAAPLIALAGYSQPLRGKGLPPYNPVPRH